MAARPHQSLLGIKSATDLEKIDHAIDMTGLNDLRSNRVSELSSGQRQHAPSSPWCWRRTRPIVMLDEAYTFLDIRHQVETLDLVRQLHALGRTSVVVLRDIGQAARYGDRVVVMKEGRIATQERAAPTSSRPSWCATSTASIASSIPTRSAAPR